MEDKERTASNTAQPERITWEEDTFKNFEKILQDIPHMIRGIAEVRVRKQAEALVSKAGRSVIEEKDMVDAFFIETPGGFQPPMMATMDELGIDYKKYGHE